ncbi:transcriptional regulator RutR [Klebsiella pneumoniae]|uniref:Transcriptional regulator RutR n=1 Tax=Klebsiella pneumoniae TaxID=573 RepID=A0A378F6C8_KLEPN|nr:transcriptional regulator RutR [Klebsiella pneumoniae]
MDWMVKISARKNGSHAQSGCMGSCRRRAFAMLVASTEGEDVWHRARVKKSGKRSQAVSAKKEAILAAALEAFSQFGYSRYAAGAGG